MSGGKVLPFPQRPNRPIGLVKCGPAYPAREDGVYVDRIAVMPGHDRYRVEHVRYGRSRELLVSEVEAEALIGKLLAALGGHHER